MGAERCFKPYSQSHVIGRGKSCVDDSHAGTGRCLFQRDASHWEVGGRHHGGGEGGVTVARAGVRPSISIVAASHTAQIPTMAAIIHKL